MNRRRALIGSTLTMGLLLSLGLIGLLDFAGWRALAVRGALAATSGSPNSGSPKAAVAEASAVPVAAPLFATINVAAGDTAGLIAAINTANNETTNPGPDTIVLGCGTYTFSTAHNWEYGPNALPPITSDITIQGNGAVLDSTAPCGCGFSMCRAACRMTARRRWDCPPER